MELRQFIVENKVLVAVIFLVAIAGLYQSGNLHSLFQYPSMDYIKSNCPTDSRGYSACGASGYGTCCHNGNVASKHVCTYWNIALTICNDESSKKIIYYPVETCSSGKVCEEQIEGYSNGISYGTAKCKYQDECSATGQTKCEGYNHNYCWYDSSQQRYIWLDLGILVGYCGVECQPGNTKCIGTSHYTCSDYKWSNQGIVKGKCGVGCVAGETKCEGVRFYYCGGNNEWTGGGLQIGECGVDCITAEDCPIDERCINNVCTTPEVTKPSFVSIWDKINATFNSLLVWLSGIFGW